MELEFLKCETREGESESRSREINGGTMRSRSCDVEERGSEMRWESDREGGGAVS